MIADKPVNPPQLQAEAVALTNTTHVDHALMYDSSDQRLWCEPLGEACQSIVEAYKTHVAVAPAPVVPLEDQVADLTARVDALSSGLAAAKDIAAMQAAASAAV